MNHKIENNPMIKDTMESGKDVEYSIELTGGEVETMGGNAEKYITENIAKIKSIIII